MLAGGVPTKYAEESTWDEVGDPKAKEWHVPQILASQIRRGHGLMIMGNPGTGKSSLAACIARDVLALSPTLGGDRMQGIAEETSILWQYVPHMMDELDEGKGARRAVRERHRRPSLVVWDDFGVDQIADWQVGYLDRLVEQRYSGRNRSLIVTTNLDGSQLRADDRLARIVDRWREMNLRVYMTGKSRRVAAE